jgi:uncharacterized protein YpmS
MSGIKPIIAFALLLLIAGLACSLPGRGTTPTPVSTLIPTLDPQVLEDQLATASAGFRETGQISVSFSEQQITSLVAQALTQQPDLPVTEPQVSLQNGKIVVTGNVKVGFITSPVEIVFEPSVQNEELHVTILSANFGSLPLPDNALQQISDTMNQNLSQFISVEGRSIQVETVTIADGNLTLTGQAR